MLQDKISSRMKDVLGEDLIRKLPKSFDGIRRIGKYYIKLLMTYIQELEHIVAHHRKVLHSESRRLRLYEICMQRRHLDTINH